MGTHSLRKLAYHEQKLLKHTSFTEWKSDTTNSREAEVLRKYHIQKREDYVKSVPASVLSALRSVLTVY